MKRCLSMLLSVLLVCTLLLSMPLAAEGLSTPSMPSTRVPPAQAQETAAYASLELPIWAVSASSTREDSRYKDKNGNPFTYPAEHLLDGDPATCWTPALIKNEVGNGIGEGVTFYFEYAAAVNKIAIMNGYCKSKDIYYANSRPAKVLVTFHDPWNEEPPSMVLELKDQYSQEYQVFTIPEQTYVEMVTIEILEVYGGSNYKGDVCISEVRLYGDWM